MSFPVKGRTVGAVQITLIVVVTAVGNCGVVSMNTKYSTVAFASPGVIGPRLQRARGVSYGVQSVLRTPVRALRVYQYAPEFSSWKRERIMSVKGLHSLRATDEDGMWDWRQDTVEYGGTPCTCTQGQVPLLNSLP